MKGKSQRQGSTESRLVCLDTDILVGLLKNDMEATHTIGKLQSEGQSLKTTIITAYELLKGSAISSRPEENLTKVKDLLSTLSVLGLSLESCEEASRIYNRLMKKGQTIGEFDILIASMIIYNEEVLVSRDPHFSLVENLNLQTW